MAAFSMLAVIAATSDAVAPNTPPDTQFLYCGPAGSGGATAISARTAITAKHNGVSTFGLFGEIYTAVQRISHPTMDVALLIFDEDLPGWHQMGRSTPIGVSITIVGYGDTGVVNAAGTGYNILQSPSIRRASPNTLHIKQHINGFGPSLITWLIANGDAAAVAGDSGGGFFIDDRLVGVTSFAFNNTGGTLPNYGFASLNGGVPYHGSGAIDLTDPELRAWVLANMARPPCDADFNGDGVADFFDVSAFLNAYSDAKYSADWNGDGAFDFFDVQAFLAAFSQGCP